MANGLILKVKQLCGDIFGENWSNGEVKIEEIQSGFVNHIYRCSLIENDSNQKDVIMRIVENKLNDQKQKCVFNGEVESAIINAKLSHFGLCPKLLGVFNGGRIEEFIQGRNMVIEDLEHSTVYIAIAKMMAKFHSVDVPLRKTPQFLEQFAHIFLARKVPVFANIQVEHHDFVRKLFEFPFEDEFKWCVQVAAKINSKIVFSHNDIHLNNIIMRNDGSVKSIHSSNTCDAQPVVVDFDFACYNYRGYDLASFLNIHEFRVISDKESVRIIYTEKKCAENFKHLFLTQYLNEVNAIESKWSVEYDTLEHLTMEVDFFILHAYLVLISFTRTLTTITSKRCSFLHVDALLRSYSQRKEEFISKYLTLINL